MQANKDEKRRNVEAVHTHTHTHTHTLLFNQIKSNKKVIVIIAIITIVIILACLILLQRNYINKIREIKLAEKEQELINMEIQIKERTDESYKCLLIFTSNDENEKIKSIEYPKEAEKEPYKITVANREGKQKVGVDYEFTKNDVDKIFKIITTRENEFSERTGYTITYNNNAGEVFKEETLLKTSVEKIPVPNLAPEQEEKHFLGWAKDNEATEPDYFEDGQYAVSNKDETLYAIWTEEQSGKTENIENESLIGRVSKINTSGVQEITVNGVTYSANVIVENNDLVLDGEKQIQGATLTDKVYEFGNREEDVAKLENGTVQDAKNMVILKVNGNLTINYQTGITACKSIAGYGGPKGLFIYVTGILSNNGTIDMTARGARAEGQDVFLWQNADGNYEYVPAAGGEGGPAYSGSGYHAGQSGIGRATGGGRSGAAYRLTASWCTAGRGGNGTSYSGGAGGRWFVWP